ncbi:MAG: ParB/RepB/Spo0J family partition protein [Oscillospiraceae bacterium]|jgi:ParB family chromosome partitioning protein
MASFFGLTREKTINRVVEIAVSEIYPNPNQPRRIFNQEELEGLATSIRHDGILQPLTVRKTANGYELVSGERRLRACRILGLEVVPCIVIDVTERNSALLALVENVQRADLSFFDEALAIFQLIELYGMTQEDAALRLGMAQSTIANKLRLLKLSECEREILIRNGLTERHARALLKLKNPDSRLDAIDKIIKHSMNVERTEAYIEQLILSDREKESFKKRAVLLRDVRLFMNTINKAIQTVQMAGIAADAKKVQNEDYIEYIIRIPVNSQG